MTERAFQVHNHILSFYVETHDFETLQDLESLKLCQKLVILWNYEILWNCFLEQLCVRVIQTDPAPLPDRTGNTAISGTARIGFCRHQQGKDWPGTSAPGYRDWNFSKRKNCKKVPFFRVSDMNWILLKYKFCRKHSFITNPDQFPDAWLWADWPHQQQSEHTHWGRQTQAPHCCASGQGSR